MYNGKPVIGLTCSYDKDETTHRIFLNHSYLDTIRHFGGVPVVLPSEGSDDELSDAAITAMKAWAEGQSATASAVSDGSVLEFTNLKYGYYVVTTTQGAAVTVASTQPNATIYDKNTTVPKELTKSVSSDNVKIGETVT